MVIPLNLIDKWTHDASFHLKWIDFPNRTLHKCLFSKTIIRTAWPKVQIGLQKD